MDNTRTTSSRPRANRCARGLQCRGRVRPRRLGLSKVVDVVSNTNHAGGQLAKVSHVTVGSRVPRDRGHAGRVPLPCKSEDFLWDGLALGTTVGAKKDGKYSAAVLTAFGETLETPQCEATSNFKHQTSNSQTFFTGKPFVEGLGHAFLMRNYRAGLAKWQTADPMGYPDGWNQLAYCNNGVTGAVDLWGCKWVDTYTKTRQSSVGFFRVNE